MSTASGEKGQQRCLLVVDDDADQRAVMSIVFGAARWRVITASNGREALELIQHHSPDLILSDMKMPEMNGEQLLAAIRQDPAFSSLPVVLLTGAHDSEREQELLRSGAAACFDKAMSARSLIAQIDRLLGDIA